MAGDALIKPLLRDDAFLADVAAADPAPHVAHLWWLGQSGFLLAHAGHHLVLDPYLSDSLTRKYADTAMPHVRMTHRVIAPERLDFVDGVTASHHHTDHLDAETLRPLLAAAPSAQLIAPAAHRTLALERAGIAPERLTSIDEGQRHRLGPFSVRAVASAHETIERDDDGHLRFLGYVVEAGPLRIYHAGDTVAHDDLASAVGPVDIALLPINGRSPDLGVAGNLDAAEAAELAAALPAARAVPCHYEMFAFNTAAPGPFVDACAARGVTAAVLRAGERLTVAA